MLEWPKDLDEPVGAELPAFERDTSNVYLVTSRDGVHLDDGWIYAHRPLIPKGARQRDWNAGFILPAAQIVSDETQHHIYFEARSGHMHHENRFNSTAVIGRSSWARDRIVGLRQAHTRSPGMILTKAFRLAGSELWVDADVRSDGASVLVEVLNAQGRPIEGFTKADVLPISRSSQRAASTPQSLGMVEARWGPSGTYGIGSAAAAHGIVMRLRFRLLGGAQLYSFEVRKQATFEPSRATTQAFSPRRDPPPGWFCCDPQDPLCSCLLYTSPSPRDS